MKLWLFLWLIIWFQSSFGFYPHQCRRYSQHKNLCHRYSNHGDRLLLLNAVVQGGDQEGQSFNEYDDMERTKMIPQSTTTFVLSKQVPKQKRRRLHRLGRWFSFRRSNKEKEEVTNLKFSYDFDQVVINSSSTSNIGSTGVMLIHPLGVGIGKWYYNRLLNAFQDYSRQQSQKQQQRLVIVSPDLIGSGSGCSPSLTTITDDHDGAIDDQEFPRKLPLLNISDWTDQLEDLMTKVEEQQPSINRWCVVANGGCSPIALQLAQRSLQKATTTTTTPSICNIVLSSVPRLSFFLGPSNTPEKVLKSYTTLCGIVGKLFWWYSCRNQGSFIQKFSEKNLVADPQSLGPYWRSNCYQTAISFQGKSKYSTFAFLAGTLQDGCLDSLNAILSPSPTVDSTKDMIQVDIIKGRDIRRNQARSWFWQKNKNETNEKTDNDAPLPSNNGTKTIHEYLIDNGMVHSREIIIGGRISLAHEDPKGYCDAIWNFLSP